MQVNVTTALDANLVYEQLGSGLALGRIHIRSEHPDPKLISERKPKVDSGSGYVFCWSGHAFFQRFESESGFNKRTTLLLIPPRKGKPQKNNGFFLVARPKILFYHLSENF